MTFAFVFLDIVDLIFLVGIGELIDDLGLDRTCIVEVVDESIVNLRRKDGVLTSEEVSITRNMIL